MAKFRAPMQALRFAEGESKVSEDIQLFRTGTFFHDEYGEFQITPEMLSKMLSNFEANVRGVDLAIDYKHDSHDIAAGWIKSLFLSQDGNELWAKVNWTPKGSTVLTEKEFRYISPEFTYDYQDNESLKKFGPTLLGAGLTNRPTIKKMDAVVELAEKIVCAPGDLDACAKDWIPQLIKEGKDQAQAVAIAYSKCRKSMGIESAEPTECEKKLMLESAQKPKPQSKGVKTMDYKAMDPAALDQMSPEDLKAYCLELMKKLEGMAGEQKVMGDKVAAMESEKKLAEKKSAFAKLLAEGKAVAAQEQAYIEDDMTKFAELSTKLNLAEGGTAGSQAAPSVNTKEEAEAKVLELAQEKMKENKSLDKGKAISMVLKEHKELKGKIYA